MKLISVLATLSVISSASAGCLRAQRRLSGDAPDSLEAPVEAAPTEHTHDRKLYPSIPCSKGTFQTVEQVFGSMANAQTCFNNAVSMMKAANWNGKLHSAALMRALHNAIVGLQFSSRSFVQVCRSITDSLSALFPHLLIRSQTLLGQLCELHSTMLALTMRRLIRPLANTLHSAEAQTAHSSMSSQLAAQMDSAPSLNRMVSAACLLVLCSAALLLHTIAFAVTHIMIILASFVCTAGMGSVYNLMWGTGDLANKIRNSNAACINFSNADLMQILGEC